MQSLLRNVCRAGNRGAAARLLEFAAPVATQPGATPPSSAIKHLGPCGFSPPLGVGFLCSSVCLSNLSRLYRLDQFLCVQNRCFSGDGVPASTGFSAKVLMARGLSTVGSAEVASDEDDSSSPAVEHPPRIKFKRPDKTARHIMNVNLVLLAGTTI